MSQCPSLTHTRAQRGDLKKSKWPEAPAGAAWLGLAKGRAASTCLLLGLAQMMWAQSDSLAQVPAVSAPGGEALQESQQQHCGQSIWSPLLASGLQGRRATVSGGLAVLMGPCPQICRQGQAGGGWPVLSQVCPSDLQAGLVRL